MCGGGAAAAPDGVPGRSAHPAAGRGHRRNRHGGNGTSSHGGGALCHGGRPGRAGKRGAHHPGAGPPQAEILPQYRDLYEQNSDMVGWLRIDGTDIDYPVMQTPGDNEYYLRRGFDKLYATSGSLFLDERCSLGPDPTANWLIYGHNMSDDTMLGELDRYADPEFYAQHPTFTFDTLTTPGTWQVAAVIRTTLGADEWPYYTFFDAGSRADWQRRVDAVMDLALYDTGITPEYGDQLLTLSTCGTSSFYTDERFAVLAVRVE